MAGSLVTLQRKRSLSSFVDSIGGQVYGHMLDSIVNPA